MFNPKEALEQIRKNKVAREDSSQALPSSTQSVFEVDQSPFEVNSRLARLEQTVRQLNSRLKCSDQLAGRLRQENSSLETQVLKLQYENSQLQTSSRVSEIRRASHLPSKVSINEFQERREQSQNYSDEVEQALEQIKQEPIESILKRKERNFRALKQESKQFQNGNKYLRELCNLEKDYAKSLKKPLLVINLNQSDFE